MPSPYSQDLRERVLRAYLDGEGSIRDVAAHFAVGPAFVQALVTRFRATGSAAPAPHGGAPPRWFPPEREREARALVEAHPDATLAELCRLLAERAGLTVAVSTLGRWVRRWGLTRKRKTSTPPSATGPTSRPRARPSPRRAPRSRRGRGSSSTRAG